jgi:CsoR family transcriptional regulator, copper-sensing transcriptional repressor
MGYSQGTEPERSEMATHPAHPGYIGDKDKLRNRLRRISGQIGGLERMVEEERYCIDILTQISATQAALDKVALELLDGHTRHCVIGAKTAADREELTEEMLGAVGRLLRSR